MHQSFPYNSLGLDILQHFKIRNKQTKKIKVLKLIFQSFLFVLLTRATQVVLFFVFVCCCFLTQTSQDALLGVVGKCRDWHMDPPWRTEM